MLVIRGIEVTQAIQYYRAEQHLTDPADRGPDNSLTLVAGKPAWVRVYVENDVPGTLANVTGTLEVRYGLMHENFGSPGLTLMPHTAARPPLSARFEPDYDTLRSGSYETLCFIIPAERMSGPLVLIVTATADGGGEPAVWRELISATLRQTLRVRAIMVGYEGPDPDNPANTLTIAAPDLAELQSTAAWTLQAMPVQSSPVFQVVSTVTRSVPLTGLISTAGCPDAWVALNAEIAAAKVADGNQPGFLYYGFLAEDYPNLSNAGGCATGGVGTSFSDDRFNFAHEIGHLCGLWHAPCGDAGGVNPNYPAYEPYDTLASRVASIGEYGLTIVGGHVPSPQYARDFMSYCNRNWISIYTHQALINNEALNPEYVGLSRPWWKDVLTWDPWWWLHYKPDPPPYWLADEVIRAFPARTHRVISIIALLHPDERVEVVSVTRAKVVSTKLAGKRSDLRVVLHGARNTEVASAAMLEAGSQASCGCSGDSDAMQRPVMLHAFLSDLAVGSGLSIRRGNKAVWKRAATRGALSVSAPKVRRSKDNESVEVSWTAKPPRAIKDTWVLVSSDEGKTWRSAATGLTRSPAWVKRSHLPAGKLLVQVVVHDGFRSVYSKVTEYDNEALPPLLAILYPDPRQRLIAGASLCLWGSVAGHIDHEPGGFRYAWTLDGKPAGEGLQVFMAVPEPGKHRCRFSALNAQGKVVRYSEGEFLSVSAEDAKAR